MPIAYLMSSSLITPLGQNLSDIQAAMQAGISRFEASDILDRYGEAINLARVPQAVIADAIDEDKIQGDPDARQRRLLRLAVSALKNMRNALLDELLPDEPLPLFLAGPDNYGISPVLGNEFMCNLAAQTDITIDLANSHISNMGRAGVLAMLGVVGRYFESGQGYFALVGGVDSYYNVGVLDYFENQQRLLCDVNSNGFIPSEGAGFLLLLSPNAPDELKQQAIAAISNPVIQQEPGHLLSEQAYKANTLSNVIAQLATQQSIIAQQLYSSINGEAHYHKELNIAKVRQKQFFKNIQNNINPAETIGDTGAAYGAIAIALAAHDQQHSSSIFASSDSGGRSAITVYSKNTR